MIQPKSAEGGLLRHIGLRSAAAIVIANIIGAGIFTSTGFQAADLGHPGYIFILWIVGGVLALCGALCYAELGSMMPEAGAEYVYLRDTYGRAFGFMSGFVSLVAGFPAPIASALKSLIIYLQHFFPALAEETTLLGPLTLQDALAVGLVWLLIAIHLRGTLGGIAFNDAVTYFKVGGIVLIILAAATIGDGDAAGLTRVSSTFEDKGTVELFRAFGTSLIFVMFCYSGWNAAAYVTSEIRDPQRNLPLALIGGTGLVVILYLGLNWVYFYGADVDELAGEVEVGLIASRNLFGPAGVSAVTIVLLVSLLASASAMTIVGPRVYYAMGRDVPLFGWLARTGEKTGAPVNALLLQGAVTSVIILTGSVDQIQQYAGFALVLFGSLAISCVIVLRIREPERERPFRAIGYPLTPLLFLGVSIWTMFWSFQGRPTESMLALLTVATGGVIFWV